MSTAETEMILSGMLRSTLKDFTAGLEVLPLINNYFNAGNRPDVNFRLTPHPLDQVAGDDWFHPSTHPTWDERALYHYLTEPENLFPDPPDMSSTLAKDFGSMCHQYIQGAMENIGILPRDLQACQSCPPEKDCREPGFEDPEVGTRGHADGILDLPNRVRGEALFEFKSAGDFGGRRMLKLDNLDVDGFRETWPDYYAQAICYQKLSGRRLSIVLMMGLGFPFHLREFHIPYDMAYANEIWGKYARVRQAVADQRPEVCGCDRNKRAGCPARRLCRS
jgi:hypothetical protein